MGKPDFMKLDKSQIILNKYSQMVSNIFLGLFFIFFVIIYTRKLISTGSPSSALYIVLNGIFFIFAFTRRSAKEVDVRFISWLLSFGGALLPLMALPSSPARGFVLGYFLQSFGIVLSIIGIISLNKSFGLVAANRGIITSGLFKFVRHPLYISYEISIIGFFINNFSYYNLFLLTIHFLCQIQRIKYEETILSNDQEYVIYMTHTKYRLIPYVY
jgi:protein-S-isoprenylcysteine O-methyltransferase Ste14